MSHPAPEPVNQRPMPLGPRGPSAAERRAAFRPVLLFPAELPISACWGQIEDALRRHQVVIVSGDTGSGKTTQLPKIAWAVGRGRAGRIGVTQPRRLAAVSMARRVAEELQCPVGRQVGYQVRFDHRTSADTVIKFMTDGILLAETTSDRRLGRYDTLIIDEAHERSLNIDFVLGYLKNLLPHRRDLKVIVSSATLDVESFSKFFDDAPVITVAGRSFPIEDVWMPPADPELDLARQVAHGVQWVQEMDPRGDMLVFLPGEREIRDTAEVLRGKQYPATEILPLFARLTLDQQQRVFAVGGRRRIILATNVAETSLTIPGIRYVLDSGLVRLSRYHPRRQIQSLQIEPVSQASARQRRGRCGRVADGVCVHLYSEETHAASPAFTDPEIRRSSLAGVILQMALLRLPGIEEFPFIQRPNRLAIAEGYQTLFEIGALDAGKNLTPLGRELAAFPVDPQIARMIVQARHEGVVSELLMLAAVLSIQDPRDRPAENAAAADAAHAQWKDERSDFHAFLRLWNAWQSQRRQHPSQGRLRRWCQANFVSYRRMLEWQNLARELAETVTGGLRWPVKINEKIHDDCFHDRILRCVLAGFPLHIGRRGDQKEYQGTRDRQFHIFPGSGLFKKSPSWVVAFSLVETLKVYARTVAAIDPVWIEQVAPHLCKSSYSEIKWDAEQGFVYAKEAVTCGGLTIIPARRVHYGRIKPEVARDVFLREGLVPGQLRSRGSWLAAHRQMLTTIRTLEQKVRRPESLLDLGAIFIHFDRLVPADVCTTKDFDRWVQHEQPNLSMAMADAMHPTLTPLVPTYYPDFLEVRGHRFELRYQFAPGEEHDGITVQCPGQLLPALPSWTIDWLVPGWLPEKIRLLVKSLPKEVRGAVQADIDEFLRVARRDQPLLAALAEFLHVQPTDFDMARLPEHLRMKIALLDSRGRVDRVLREKPTEIMDTYELDPGSAWMPKGLHRTGLKTWAEPALSESIELPGGARGFPAFVDEGTTVGVRVYLEERVAREQHHAGLVRLFRLQHGREISFLERRLPLPTFVQAELSAWPGEGANALEDFVNFVIEESLDPATLHSVAAERSQSLAALLEQRTTLLRQMDTTQPPPRMRADIEGQMAFLFRPGFLHGVEIWRRYPRYLEAVRVRLERLKLSPPKDQAKWDALRPFQEALDAQLERLPRRRLPADVLRFATLLQEFRIAQFAPELGPFEKASAKALAAALPAEPRRLAPVGRRG